MSAPGLVYFLRPVGALGPVKIGFSYSPPSRLRTMAKWSPIPLELVAYFPGTQKLERNIQDCLWASRSHFEWFLPTDRVVAVVTALIAGVPIEQCLDLSDRSEGRGRNKRRRMTEAEKATAKVYRERSRAAKARQAELANVGGVAA